MNTNMKNTIISSPDIYTDIILEIARKSVDSINDIIGMSKNAKTNKRKIQRCYIIMEYFTRSDLYLVRAFNRIGEISYYGRQLDFFSPSILSLDILDRIDGYEFNSFLKSVGIDEQILIRTWGENVDFKVVVDYGFLTCLMNDILPILKCNVKVGEYQNEKFNDQFSRDSEIKAIQKLIDSIRDCLLEFDEVFLEMRVISANLDLIKVNDYNTRMIIENSFPLPELALSMLGIICCTLFAVWGVLYLGGVLH